LACRIFAAWAPGLQFFNFEEIKHMKTKQLIIVAGLLTGPAASAAWWTPNDIKRICGQFLTAAKAPLPPLTGVSAAYRNEFNQISLNSSRALLIYEPNQWMEVVNKGQMEVLSWLDTVTRRAINVVLDTKFPDWRHEGYWYFQTAFLTTLYSPKSRAPIQFDAGTFILMKEQYAIGRIFLANRPHLDLWE
jgi:hypothetical protein